MNLWQINLTCFLCGLSLGVVFVILLIRRLMRKRLAFRKFISELYHQDLLPEVCRIQGLLNIALMESKLSTAHAVMYIELAIKEMLAHKEKIIKTIKKYE